MLAAKSGVSAVVIPAVVLSSGSRILKAHIVLRDKLHKFRRGMGNYTVPIFAGTLVDTLRTQRPDYLNAGVAIGYEGVGNRDHAHSVAVTTSRT
jgi:hypothetical protein